MANLEKEQVTLVTGRGTVFLNELVLSTGEGIFNCEEMIFTYHTDIPISVHRDLVLIRDKKV